RLPAAEVALEKVGEGALGAKEIVQVLRVDRAVLEAAGLAGVFAPEGRPAERAGRRLLARVGPLPLLVFLPVGAKLVVLLALLRVGPDLVGLVDRFELLLGLLVALVHVRMVLAGKLPVGRLDLFVRSRLRHPEDRVIVLKIQSVAPRCRVSGHPTPMC